MVRGGTTMTSQRWTVTVPRLGQPEVEIDLSPFRSSLAERHRGTHCTLQRAARDGFGDLMLIGSVNYRGEVYSSATTHPNDAAGRWVDSYHVFNLSAEWNGIMGSNFHDAPSSPTSHDTYRLSNYIGLQQASGFTNSIYGEPRMYGLCCAIASVARWLIPWGDVNSFGGGRH
ncbi:MAG: hypothetical protein IPO61_07375 [Gammaproteobacteria bacterium]|nr:hypothetical protein [Gammaproteobacteria bacterium]